jgi:hypothetical protein
MKRTEHLTWQFDVPSAQSGLRTPTGTMIALGTLVKNLVISTAC